MLVELLESDELPLSVDFLASPALSEEAEGFDSALPAFFSVLDELYRSAYQPPPFKMNPAPPDTCRFAASAWQLGQVFNGASLIDCSASQACPQAVHRYS